jgi:hypothetical protein
MVDGLIREGGCVAAIAAGVLIAAALAWAGFWALLAYANARRISMISDFSPAGRTIQGLDRALERQAHLTKKLVALWPLAMVGMLAAIALLALVG